MTLPQIVVLSVVQGLAEMLPISSSAHVIVAQKLMGLDPTAPELTFLLVMLHTGTMLAALLYFWNRWKKLIFGWDQHHFLKMILFATACTGVVGLGLKIVIEKILLEHLLHHPKGEVEAIFGNLYVIGFALLAAGVLILWSSKQEGQGPAQAERLSPGQSALIGLIQGFCLPFRGFSRSGATISTGMTAGVSRQLSEEFSFALAVALTPAAIALEADRLLKSLHAGPSPASVGLTHALVPGLLGMIFSFAAGLLALRWLSSWLERGKWGFFGYYCVGFSAIVLFAAFRGM